MPSEYAGLIHRLTLWATGTDERKAVAAELDRVIEERDATIAAQAARIAEADKLLDEYNELGHTQAARMKELEKEMDEATSELIEEGMAQAARIKELEDALAIIHGFMRDADERVAALTQERDDWKQRCIGGAWVTHAEYVKVTQERDALTKKLNTANTIPGWEW